MVVKELAQLVVLLGEVREVDEEPAAHVALHGLDRLRPGRSVVLHQKVAVLQQAAAPDGDHAREHGDDELDNHGEQGDDAHEHVG